MNINATEFIPNQELNKQEKQYQNEILCLKESIEILKRWNPKTFPNINNVFKLLQKTIICDDGSISMIVNAIFSYNTLYKEVYNGYDIYEQLKVITNNLPLLPFIYHKLIKYLLSFRNIIVHHGIINVHHIQKMIINIINVFENDDKFYNHTLFITFYNQWKNIYKQILSKAPLFVYLTDNVITNRQPITNQQPIIIITNQQPIIIEEMSSDNITLKYLRDNGWKEKLKNKQIQFLDGKWKDYIVVFLSWKGTSAKVKFDDDCEILVNITRFVKVL